MPVTSMKPSSATAGFFQELPSLPNQFYDDASFQRTLKRKPHRHRNAPFVSNR
jgi:hypothetical protein